MNDVFGIKHSNKLALSTRSKNMLAFLLLYFSIMRSPVNALDVNLRKLEKRILDYKIILHHCLFSFLTLRLCLSMFCFGTFDLSIVIFLAPWIDKQVLH